MFEVLSDPAIYEFENEPSQSERELVDRFAWLERRSSPDGRQRWLNGVTRLPEGHLAGYVRATVLPDSRALPAYGINSRYWRRGIATAAVSAMMIELAARLGVHAHVAVLKAANYRSLGLLRRLGLVDATPERRHTATRASRTHGSWSARPVNDGPDPGASAGANEAMRTGAIAGTGHHGSCGNDALIRLPNPPSVCAASQANTA